MVAQRVKCLPAIWETWVQSLGWEAPLEKEMAIHSSTLAWKIPWMEEPGSLWSMGFQRGHRVGHDWATELDWLDCSLPSSSVHGIFQARILEWVAISFSRGASQPRDRTQISCMVCRCFTIWATREANANAKQSERGCYSRWEQVEAREKWPIKKTHLNKAIDTICKF